jgi:hypothetical protein
VEPPTLLLHDLEVSLDGLLGHRESLITGISLRGDARQLGDEHAEAALRFRAQDNFVFAGRLHASQLTTLACGVKQASGESSILAA